MDYNFTADVEKKFDEIAEGKANWTNVIREFYNDFEPLVESAANTRTEHKVGERVLGNDPETGEPITVKIGRFGPVAQIGSTEAEEKPRFAQLKKGQSLETITLDEALELFRLPRNLGKFENVPIIIGAGKFGPYVSYGGSYISVPKNINPLTMTIQEAITLIVRKRREEAERHLKTFTEEPELEVLNGRFGPYLAYKGNNYRLPKNLQGRATQLTLEECMNIINGQDAKTNSPTKTATVKRHYSRKS